MANKSRTDLQTLIDVNLPDNTSKAITPAKSREVATDANDSTFNKITDDLDDINDGVVNVHLTNATQDFDGEKTFLNQFVGSSPIKNETETFTLTDSNINKTLIMDVAVATVITLDDSLTATANFGDAIPVYWVSDSGTSTITFNAIESQSIISLGGSVGMSAVGAKVELKYVATNTWTLTGDLI